MYCKIKGGLSLNGDVSVFGAKNEALKLFVASCITSGDIILHNIPLIEDVYEKISLLESMNVKIQYVNQRSLYINSENMIPECPLQFTRIRTSINLLGLLLGRFGYCVIPVPHGDKIGSRKLDMHIDALEQMGAKICIDNGIITAEVPNKILRPIEYTLKFQSMGATENIIMAAVFANGTTIINNASIEPEVKNLCLFINNLGKKIEGIGTSRLIIHGSSDIITKSMEYIIQSDRMQIMTYMLLPLMTPNTNIAINYKGQTNFGEFLHYVLKLGLNINIDSNQIICSKSKIYNTTNNYDSITTGVFPLFHTDILPPFVTALCINSYHTLVTDYIYDNRFSGYINELRKMNANIIPINSNQIEVKQIIEFQQTNDTLFINDIRCGPTLLLAALNCNGVTKIGNFQQCERGYENIIHNLQKIGAKISINYENGF